MRMRFRIFHCRMILHWKAFHKYLFDVGLYLLIKKNNQPHVKFKPVSLNIMKIIIWAPHPVFSVLLIFLCGNFKSVLLYILLPYFLWYAYLKWLFISFRLAIALWCVLHDFASPFPWGISECFCFSWRMTTYLGTTGNQVLYSHCQHL